MDTSIWIDHLHEADARLQALLEEGQVATHPMVVGELRLGRLRDRATFLSELNRLPRYPLSTDHEVEHLVEHRRLWGRGLSLVAAHLLASALIRPDGRLWTRDKSLRAAAAELGVGAD